MQDVIQYIGRVNDNKLRVVELNKDGLDQFDTSYGALNLDAPETSYIYIYSSIQIRRIV